VRHVILGGTGTLGQALTDELLRSGAKSIVIFSRCELKQKEMASRLRDERVRFVLGDIRDSHAVRHLLKCGDHVFHVAALKHVEIAEENPEESLKTNVLGTLAAADAAIAASASFFSFCSTDKAVDPVNTYGFTKALAERILLRKNRTQFTTRFSVFRWGNIINSRGSFFHTLADQLRNEQIARITDLRMTRFWLKIEDAAKFMLINYASAPIDSALIPPMRAAPVTTLVRAVAGAVQVPAYHTEVIGCRPGEKIHEAIRSQHEPGHLTSETASQYTPDELAALIAPLFPGAA
jgi:UDP-N-acetylglucosamine 4,6-dehydratase/5-epimerase